MWIDVRQHIASLVAVFLALGIGMLIGGTIPGAGRLDEHEQALIRNLEASLDRIELRNEELKEGLSAIQARWERSSRLNDVLLGLAFEGELDGRRVNILRAGPAGLDAVEREDEALRALRGLLQRSGAEVLSVPPGERISGARGGDGVGGGFSHAVLIRTGRNREHWAPAWEQLSRLKNEGVSVIVAQSSTLPALPPQLSDRAGKRGDGKGLLLVDHIDRPTGMFTLLEGLRTPLSGHYGRLDGAVGRYPGASRGADGR